MNSKIVISNGQRKQTIPAGTRLLIRRCCHAVLRFEGINIPFEISISITDNEGIRKLNKEFRNMDVETDVLSFPLLEKGDVSTLNDYTHPVALGDIVLSIEKAYAQASMYNHSIQREIAFLVAHSMFHLLGYDHEEGGMQEVYMREKEEAVLTQLGLSRGHNYVAID